MFSGCTESCSRLLDWRNIENTADHDDGYSSATCRGGFGPKQLFSTRRQVEDPVHDTQQLPRHGDHDMPVPTQDLRS